MQRVRDERYRFELFLHLVPVFGCPRYAKCQRCENISAHHRFGTSTALYLDGVSGLHNCLEFSQLSSCLDEAMKSPLLLNYDHYDIIIAAPQDCERKGSAVSGGEEQFMERVDRWISKGTF